MRLIVTLRGLFHHNREWTVIRNPLSLIVVCLLLTLSPFGHAREDNAPSSEPTAEERAQLQQSRQQLQDIQQSLLDKRTQLEQLRGELEQAVNETEGQELQEQITQLEADLINLRQAFENIALGGIDTGTFSQSDQEQEFNWQNELQQILKPLFEELKDLTEKPRAVERLRSQLTVLNEQQRVAERALANLERLRDDSLGEAAAQRLEMLFENWQQRLTDVQRQREINQLQLDSLLGQDESTLDQVSNSLYSFFSGRGLNLGLTVAAFFLVWFLMKGLQALYNRLTWRGKPRGTGSRIMLYGYRALSVLLALMAALLTLYVVGDIVLLALALIILFAVILGLRNYLPRFIAETKLLLNIGAVRERERVIYNGLPWQIRSLNVYSRLYNPQLEGLLRLPLAEMSNLVSRPYRQDEPWFPTKVGDFVILADGTFGQVLRQTPEMVQLKALSSPRTYATTDFLASQPRNLSHGFGVAASFGIDYQHQPICTDEVPGILHEAISRALAASSVAEQVEDVLVDFKEAGASSLDYLVYVSMGGEAAGSYYTIGRIIQRACVEVCNERGWVIPFNQLTVHAGDGFGSSGENPLDADRAA